MSVPVEAVAATRWRDACAAALEAGERFCGLYALDGGEARALFARSGAMRVLACPEGPPSIVDLAPAANWDEREAHDLYGLQFPGHEPLRSLVEHPDELEAWTVPVRGHDPHQVAVGPIHAGVIESGHFRFHLVGERILLVDLRLFYKHRGLERAAEGRSLDEGLTFAQRACAACSVANGVAYAQACEAVQGRRADPALAAERTVLLELERLWNHLNDIGAVCAGVGFAPGSMLFASLKERAQRLNERLAGHRFLFGTVAAGEGRFTVGAEEAAAVREELAALRRASAYGWRELLFNASLQERLDEVGVVTEDAARSLGVVGPAARAAGLALDVRTESPQLAYDGFFPARAARSTGDVAARLELRAVELEQTFGILERLLAAGAIGGGGTEPAGEGAPLGVGRVESPRGETICVVEANGGRIGRLRLRTGSYANWPAVAHAAAGNLLPDFPLINKSFELCYACADR